MPKGHGLLQNEDSAHAAHAVGDLLADEVGGLVDVPQGVGELCTEPVDDHISDGVEGGMWGVDLDACSCTGVGGCAC